MLSCGINKQHIIRIYKEITIPISIMINFITLITRKYPDFKRIKNLLHNFHLD